ncbi:MULTISPECIES: Hsp70 family protein [Actinokineospora]|uniref:Molecular chaperone Hsp70 n=1 Tax=Actinokineospora fastidiosa TaxID=1816 RepID=A0A918GJW4_9PSEU|nr:MULTISPECIES: Hsp70 family protein [Actinokineospora]UVS77894.1 Heat shock protein 70 [Actinokineospora sp. UTMC 2448]GGS40276.1 molecular chaperone Hsp70 [Actinokineospora fastidiosa]
MNVLSVDLGTSNTVAVLAAHGRPPRVVDVDGSSMMPSAVFAAEDGGLVVGRDAERRARLDPSRFEPNPKRRVDEGTLLLGDVVVPVTDALAGVLRRVADETSRQLAGKKPDEVRLTHPAQWGPVRRNVLLSAARQAGMGSNIVLVPEPVAAAAHFASFPGQKLAPGQALAVYDLGAGTFDVAVVGATQKGFVVLAEAGLPDLGGLDVDQALLEHVGRQVSHRDPAGWQRLLRPESTGDRRAQRALREDVKAAKEALSRHPQTEVPLPEPFEDVLVTRVELEALIRPGLLRSVELLAATIRSTGMSPDRLAGIYLVGGSSRIPLIATLIAEQLRVVPTSLDQPETAVALGAHHVPQEGVTMRTGDMSGAIENAQRTQAMVPRTGGFTAQPQTPAQPFPPRVPAQRPGPPSTPVPAQGPPSAPIPVGTPGPPSQPNPLPHYPAPRPPQKANSNKMWYLATAIVAVVVVGVVSVIIATSGGGSGDLAADCSDQNTDASGFTPCMREVAGDVLTTGDCESGINLGTRSIPTPGAKSATCTLDDGYIALYYHFDSADLVDQNIDAVIAGMGKNKSDAQTGAWNGGKLSGTYYEVEILEGAAILLFSVDDTPIMGSVAKLTPGDGPVDLTDYFEKNIKPSVSG